MFIDEMEINLIAGQGGDGSTSFRREKHVAMGGPDGGNGGRGGDIVFKVDKNLKTLIDLSYLKIIKGNKGTNGSGKNKYGKSGEDKIIYVPEGTAIINSKTNQVICDLVGDLTSFVVAKGGRGGRGNASFKTENNTAPKFSEYGEPGEEILVKLELKLLADVGLVGFPNVGKSTILSVVSNSKPKIANYHFTTLSPNLGIVKVDNESFVMADLPGLIEGAHKGVGLGDRFLKHTSRVKLIAHVIDISGFDNRDPIRDYEIIRNELKSYNVDLYNKDEIIILNKIDIASKDNILKFKEKYKEKEIIEISAVSKENINELIYKINNKLKTIKEVPNKTIVEYTLENEEEDIIITKFNNGFKVQNKNIEKLVSMTKFTEEEGVLRLSRIFNTLGLNELLKEHGAKPGDEIYILDQVFTYKG